MPKPTFLLFAAVALGACAERTEPDQNPVPMNGYNMVDPVRVSDPGGPIERSTSASGEVTLGTWRPDTEGTMQGVAFAAPQGEALLRLFCDDRRGMVVERTGLTPSGDMNMMTFRARDVGRRLAVNPTGSDGTVLRAVLPLNDELTAVLQEGPVPIQVAVGEGEPLSLPPSPLVAMLAAECSKL